MEDEMKERETDEPPCTDERLIFPCGAYYPLNEWPVDGAHYAKDGAVRITVYPGTAPYVDYPSEYNEKWESQGSFAPKGSDGLHHTVCLYGCPTPKRMKTERGFDAAGKLGEYVFCHARLYACGIDVTPPPPAKCPHCEEQRTYVAACKRAAKRKEKCPGRERWGLCPQCQEYREVTTDTGLCTICQDSSAAQWVCDCHFKIS